jgi:hypothetical protein
VWRRSAWLPGRAPPGRGTARRSVPEAFAPGRLKGGLYGPAREFRPALRPTCGKSFGAGRICRLSFSCNRHDRSAGLLPVPRPGIPPFACSPDPSRHSSLRLFTGPVPASPPSPVHRTRPGIPPSPVHLTRPGIPPSLVPRTRPGIRLRPGLGPWCFRFEASWDFFRLMPKRSRPRTPTSLFRTSADSNPIVSGPGRRPQLQDIRRLKSNRVRPRTSASTSGHLSAQTQTSAGSFGNLLPAPGPWLPATGLRPAHAPDFQACWPA